LATRGEQQESAAVRPGQSVDLKAPPAVGELTVAGPRRSETTVARSDQDQFPFTATEVPGIYAVRHGETVVERFAVNLFDRAESDVAVRPTQDPESSTVRPADIRIGHVDVAASTDRTPARREAWKVVLACALFVLLLEWYIYNRRVYI
jgi:hypothetical protein